MIDLQHISQIYNRYKPNQVTAVNDVALSIAEGEMVAITGASGSGKTTLLNIIAGLLKPSCGEYTFFDNQMHSLSLREIARVRNRYMGIVMQNLAILPDLSVYNNIQIPLLFNKDTNVKDMKSKIEKALFDVGLRVDINRKALLLSGGEQQRVAIARALINDPSVILADEPTGNLDSANSDVIVGLLKEINQTGKTVILITHNTDIANRCGRIISLSDGKVVGDSLTENK